MRLRLQYTKHRHWAGRYTGPESVPEEDWKNYKALTIEKDVLTLNDGVSAMQTLKKIVEDTTHAYGISEAYWRLVLEDAKTTRVTITGGESVKLTNKVRAISPVYKQGVDTVDVNDIFDLAWSGEATGEEPLPSLLDKTPIPDGTVVQILDEWGEPINTTEVVT
jgi:hypothetical protein